MIGNASSSLAPLMFGVPPGSILGTFLIGFQSIVSPFMCMQVIYKSICQILYTFRCWDEIKLAASMKTKLNVLIGPLQPAL